MLIDAHSHLDLYETELPAALAEIGLHKIFTISNSLGLESFQRNEDIAQRCEWVLPIFGVHPWFASHLADRLDELSNAIERSPMLGEIGLDHHFVEDASQYPAQRKVFEFFLAAARDQDKIVHLHTKGAEQEVLDLLDRHTIQRAVVHWYSGPLDILSQFVSRGAYVTVGMEVAYSEQIQAIARATPAAQLLTETDNPGGPRSLIGRPGMPSLIVDVVQALADVRGTSPTSLTQLVQANLARLLRDDPWLDEAHARVSAGLTEQGGEA
jgi:TatD DNase family protein